MTTREYNSLQEQMLDAVIKNIKPDDLPMRFMSREKVNNTNEIYKSAVAAPDPITVVNTGMGSERSQLIKDRIELLVNDGHVDPKKIKLLALNIAKAAEFGRTTPADAMTYNDFCTNLFLAQFPDINLADDISIKNSLMLYPKSDLRDQFIKVMNMNPQDQIVFLEMFINKHLTETLDMLKFIRKVSHKIASVVTMNYMYQFTINPYADTEEIILYNAQNIPVPCLCTVLLYTQRFHNTLYILNAECETIFQFAGAVPGGINRLEATLIGRYNINNNVKMDPDIVSYISNPGIITPKVHVTDTRKSITEFLDEKGLPKDCQLVLTRNKKELEEVEQWITGHTKLSVRKISAPNSLVPNIDTFAVNSLPVLLPKYPWPNKITVENYTRILTEYMSTVEDMKDHVSEAKEFLEKAFDKDSMVDIYSLTAMIIDKIAIMRNNENEHNTQTLIKDSTKKYDITLSTIHGAVDMRADNVFIIATNLYDKSPVTNPLLKVAESRANKALDLLLINASS